MPEYLAPGVYVEEIDTGNKPIEGVSTSTTGLIGVTQRGPVNVPVLVTSFADYRRVFGDTIDIEEFKDSTGRAHSYLPHAVEGFFTNGGKRAWVTRAAPREAARASRRLFFRDPDATGVTEASLLRAAEEGTGTAANRPPLYVYGRNLGDLSGGEVVRVGDGSRAEYRTFAALGTAARHVSLSAPLQREHRAGRPVRDVVRTLDASYSAAFQLAAAAPAGAKEIIVQVVSADLPTLLALTPSAPQLIEVGGSPAAEYAAATAAADLGGLKVRLTLADPLQRGHALPASPLVTPVTALEIPAGTGQTLAIDAGAGDSLVYLDTLSGGYTNTTHLVVIDAGAADQEVRRIGQLATLELATNGHELYPPGSVVERVTMPGDIRTVAASGTDTTTSTTLNDASGIAPGMQMILSTGPTVTVTSVRDRAVGFQPAVAAVVPTGTTATLPPRALASQAAAGDVVISLDNRLGLAPGDVLRIGAAPAEEYGTVREISEPRSVPPDAGAVVLTRPLRRTHVSGAAVQRQHVPTVDPARQPTLVLLASGPDSNELLVVDGSGYAAMDVVRVLTPSTPATTSATPPMNAHYHVLTGNVAASPRDVTLTGALERSHSPGAAVVERSPLLEVRALDPGAWGNRVLVSCAAEQDGLLARAEVTAATPPPGPGIPTTLRLTTVTGVEAGTVLELIDPVTAGPVGELLKVRQIDRAAGNLVILDPPGLSATHIAAHTAAQLAGRRLIARSRELRLEVLLQAAPDPAVPSRNDDIVDRELFRHLSMDPRHSRYVERIVGSTWDDTQPNDDLGRPLRRWDRRSEGESAYLRVHDIDAGRERVRLGPEALVDVLPSGSTRPARHRLGGGDDAATLGDDSVATMTDAMYLGVDDREPERRTGIFAWKSVDTISLVAAPGQTTTAVQQALIDHCEEQRYRFAVLDSYGPPRDTLADVQAQRQQFDTKYAAIYFPWLTIPDPFPDNLAAVAQLPIPPSGHVLGIYARTDVERGVHKAPANEVVRGILGLTRYLNKGEQDILNAFPVHVNVIRDFRPNNRGIRVWGARCITSDSDFKYVNVRRLLIFLEDSIDRGLQWVVFEPNAPALWARVRRTITNFLTVVWRNGALEGTAPEQGFFVKCDRTTMTQADIDSGRLICVIGVAPVKPAEFVIIRIGLWTADAET
jgi:hypothetical protein